MQQQQKQHVLSSATTHTQISVSVTQATHWVTEGVCGHAISCSIYYTGYTVCQRVDFKVATLVHRSLSGNSASYLADDCRLVADAREWQLRSIEPDMHRYPDPQHFWWQSFCRCRSRAMEQFTATSQRCGLTIQSVPAVTKDIFVWTVGPRRSANYFNWAA